MESTHRAELKKPLQLSTDKASWNSEQQVASMVINAVNNTDDRTHYALSTEPGNTSCYSLTSGYYPVGHINLNDGAVAVLSTNNTNSEIGIARHCTYTALINNTCLGFDNNFGLNIF